LFVLRHEERLKKEEELGLALQAQHGAMKKEFSMLLKDAEQQREDIKRLKDKEARLQENIRNLEKDIQSHKKEIRLVPAQSFVYLLNFVCVCALISTYI
jgi:septation ring formation regulator EzrA